MKKTGLFKIILILIFVVTFGTWVFSASKFSNGEIMNSGVVRVGFFDLFSLTAASFQQFLQTAIFILSVGGLYGILNKTNAYRAILEKIAKSLKGKETIFLISVSFLFAALSAAFGFELILFIFIPAVISIILLLGNNKFTAYLSTFGAILIGTIGSVINLNVLEINSSMGLEFADNLLARLVLFVLSFALLTAFTLINIKKDKKSKAKDETIDLFLPEKKEKSSTVKTWPIYATFGFLFVIIVLACIYWTGVFEVDIFSKALEAINSFEIFGVTLFKYILGNTGAFGTWSYFELTIVIFILSLIIAKMYKVNLSEAITEGAKKVLKPALLILLSYVVVYVVATNGFYTTIINYAIEHFKHLSVGISSMLIAIGSLFHMEFNFLSYYVFPQLVAAYTKTAEVNALAILSQSIYGLSMFVAPTSIMLILGLEYLNISYKKWLQYIWKLVVALLIVILAVSLIIRYI
jgi:uncharacterized ion transporter superfamily protein YfcC